MALIDDFLPALAFAALLATEPNLADTPYETARKDIDRLLDQALLKARKEHLAQADNALFAVCAFADEAILGSTWPGRTQWMRHKLQEVRFNTANAGEEFYERLTELYGKVPKGQLDMSLFDNLNKVPEEDQRGALEVFAACMTLGFKGRYHDLAGKAQIDELTRTNLEQLYTEQRLSQEKVFPEIYSGSRLSFKKSWLSPTVRTMALFIMPTLIAAGVYIIYTALLTTFVNNWLNALG